MSTYNPIVHPGFVGFEAWGGGEEGDGTDMYGHAATRPPHGREFGQFTRETPEDIVSNGLENDIPIPARVQPPTSGRRRMVNGAFRTVAKAA